jgi:hypothetical protein
MFSILYLLSEGQTAESPVIIRSIITKITEVVDDSSARRLSALVILFNLTTAPQSKVDILLGKFNAYFLK